MRNYYLKFILINIFCLLFVFGVQARTNINAQLETHLEDFVKVYNKNDTNQLRNFIEDNFVKGINVEAELLRWKRWFSIYGEISFHSEVLKEPNRYRAFYRGNLTKAWVELTIFPTLEDANTIRRIAVGSGLKPNTYKIQKLNSEKDLIKTVENYASVLQKEDIFSGSILIAKGEKVLYKKGFGYANKSFKAPNNSDTKFSLGSITKVFTALAIFQLHEQGKLSLDDSLSKFLPDYPNSKGINISHLLTHTSGLGRGEYDRAIFPMSELSVDELVNLTIAEKEFEAGKDIHYSNGAFILLGKIVERVSGENYYEFIKKNTFKKAEMSDSDFYETDETVPNLAVGYSHAKYLNPENVEFFTLGKRRNTVYLNGYKGSPAGLSYSSVNDLFKFYRALQNNKLLSKNHTKLFLVKQVEIPAENTDEIVKRFYGFGWEIDETRGKSIIRKDGGSWGCSTRIAIIPNSDYLVVVLSNYDSIGPVVTDHITDLILENF